ncbi:MAG: cysteine hydrolase [Pseudomonadota bacterium]|nr:cysteine hydrolase [Pseudomonadota bacterium]
MSLRKTALLLIGFQNDYFAEDGILHSVIEASSARTGVKQNTLNLLRDGGSRFGLVLSTPIYFTPDYRELDQPAGILRTIREVGAFRRDSPGSAPIPEFGQYAKLIREVPGKRGLNAFSNTELERILREHGIDHLVLAGTVTSICIDSTGRDAAERGFKVTVLSDCTSSRTVAEQSFYVEQVFPLYATVSTSAELLRSASAAAPRSVEA